MIKRLGEEFDKDNNSAARIVNYEKYMWTLTRKLNEVIDCLNVISREMDDKELFQAFKDNEGKRSQELQGLGIGINPILEEYVKCLDCKKPIYSSFSLEKDHKNCDMYKQEPKWAQNETGYWINYIDNVYMQDWKVDTTRVDIYDTKEMNDPNLFKTKEQAEAALKEIQQVMRKYH